jgi:hypothetical protein
VGPDLRRVHETGPEPAFNHIKDSAFLESPHGRSGVTIESGIISATTKPNRDRLGDGVPADRARLRSKRDLSKTACACAVPTSS